MATPRFDFLDIEIEVRNDVAAGVPLGPNKARDTAEGYLVVDLVVGRDGFLKYTDGTDTWLEYRPREELLRVAADPDVFPPVTNDHPPAMVSAETWAQFAKGYPLGSAYVTEPDVEGVSYLVQPSVIGDAELIQDMKAGKKLQVSMGYTMRAADGTNGALFTQRDLKRNHDAIVKEGRAGPNCRALMDGAAWSDGSPMKNKKPEKADELGGSPQETVEIQAPDGTMAQVPTWVAAMLTELMELKQASMAPPAPMPDAAPAQAPVLAPAVPDAAPPAPAPAAEPEKDPSKDSIENVVRRRARLERLATKVGMDDATIESLDTEDLARAYVSHVNPAAAKAVAQARGDALDLAVELASVAAPTPEKKMDAEPRLPWRLSATPVRADELEKLDACDETLAKFLASQGYA